MTDDLTTIETTLRDLLAVRASILTGAIANAHGWPAPDAEEGAEMSRFIVRALTELVRGMRHPDAHAPSQEELSLVLHGVAYGVLERVLGLVPPPERPRLTLVN